jgi:hypothetical protein
MLILLIFSVFLGAVLGVRFRVFVLIPAIAGCLFAVMVFGIGLGASPCTLALATIVAATALELSYLGGCATHFIIESPRLTPSSKSLPRATGDRRTT